MAPGASALEGLGCEREKGVLAYAAAGEDWLAARDRAYYDASAGSAWPGSAAWLESEGVGHVFFLLKPECERANQLTSSSCIFNASTEHWINE
ncbi:unnamed protein product [Urochloa humidicola]